MSLRSFKDYNYVGQLTYAAFYFALGKELNYHHIRNEAIKEHATLLGYEQDNNRYNAITYFIRGIYKENEEMGINSAITDINTSEVDKYWRNFTSLMINDDFLISQSIEPFKAVNEVFEMYYKIEDKVVEFFILLDNEEYDFELMHRIFALERMIKKMWDGKYLDFHYGPEKFIDKVALRGYHIAYKRG